MKDFEIIVDDIVAKRKSELPSNRNSLKGLAERLEKMAELTPVLENDLNEALNKYLGGKRLDDRDMSTIKEIFQKAMRNFLS